MVDEKGLKQAILALTRDIPYEYLYSYYRINNEDEKKQLHNKYEQRRIKIVNKFFEELNNNKDELINECELYAGCGTNLVPKVKENNENE